MSGDVPANCVKVALLVTIDNVLTPLEGLLATHLAVGTTSHADTTEPLGLLPALAASLAVVPRILLPCVKGGLGREIIINMITFFQNILSLIVTDLGNELMVNRTSNLLVLLHSSLY